MIYNSNSSLHKTMTVTTNEHGQNNMFAREPQMYVSQTDAERYGYETYAEKAEKLNGRTAMLGFVAALVSYATTGSIFFFGAFGIWWFPHSYHSIFTEQWTKTQKDLTVGQQWSVSLQHSEHTQLQGNWSLEYGERYVDHSSIHDWRVYFCSPIERGCWWWWSLWRRIDATDTGSII